MGGTPKWIYKGKSQSKKDDLGETPMTMESPKNDPIEKSDLPSIDPLPL